MYIYTIYKVARTRKGFAHISVQRKWWIVMAKRAVLRPIVGFDWPLIDAGIAGLYYSIYETNVWSPKCQRAANEGNTYMRSVPPQQKCLSYICSFKTTTQAFQWYLFVLNNVETFETMNFSNILRCTQFWCTFISFSVHNLFYAHYI